MSALALFNPSKREMDVLLTVGEQISVALMAMQLEKMRLPVVSLTGWQIEMNTDSTYGAARIKSISTERIRRELDKNRIVLVAGFQGINKYGDVTTLGRGGSDTTAVAIAAVLGADKCRRSRRTFSHSRRTTGSPQPSRVPSTVPASRRRSGP